MNVLFTNAGRRTYLIEDALKIGHGNEFQLGVFVCDSSPWAAAMLVSQDVQTFVTPRVSDNPERYAEVLLEECRKRGICMVIPLMDYELTVLAERAAVFRAEGIHVVVSSPEVVKTTLDKRLCWGFCREHGLAMPRSWFDGARTEGAVAPLILKRAMGSGSVELSIIGEPAQIPGIVPCGFILQEMIAGDEYGMDVLNDFNGEFVHCCVRRKMLMRAGETDIAEVVYDERFFELGRIVSAAFKHRGNLDLDFMVDSSGNISFLDFNPRFGGGYPFTVAAGFDYLRVLLRLEMGEKPHLPWRGRRIRGAKGYHLFAVEDES